jgi:hypothetical protein
MRERRENKFEVERAKSYVDRGNYGVRAYLRMVINARSGLRYGDAGEGVSRRFRMLGSWGSAIVGVSILVGVPVLALWFFSTR